jgi:putative component of toxin-antitoxin plasmid stabilization module
MPATEITYYADADGRSPIVEWLDLIRQRDRRAFINCMARLKQLASLGHELRRPAADYLRDGIFELRAKKGHVQFRLLYFFHGRTVAVVAHGIVKQGSAVDPMDIDRALQRKRVFSINPQLHSYHGDMDHD